MHAAKSQRQQFTNGSRDCFQQNDPMCAKILCTQVDVWKQSTCISPSATEQNDRRSRLELEASRCQHLGSERRTQNMLIA